ncbi:hypothetical protein BDV27DRAFT_144731 [Aspergillus caelatus]|uniref:Uncharacterized protein n=1 Tax=Aspergillus caelatus TaxID=61420 RepID=A0A5N7A6Q8_9EURO|nr:uncharacterized protein BDV27DRAFT_144731 [Aspergillus caelatus]KAE8365118.1 hypothetical protein BDV27DRAFT_144731 [Aspergillus caelatus]
MAEMKIFLTITGYLTRTLTMQQSMGDRFTRARKDLQPLFTSQTCIFPVGLFALIVSEQSQIIWSHVPRPSPHAGPVVKVSALTTTSTLTFTDGSLGQRIEHYR